MEAHGAIWQEDPKSKRQVATCPICCDSTLDDEELDDPFCGCGFQLCSFCLNRIQNESDNICPHCRTSYEDGPQEELYEHLSKLVEQRQQAEKEARALQARHGGDGASAVSRFPNQPRTVPIHPSPPSPVLHLEEETIWPGLAAPPKKQTPTPTKKPQNRKTSLPPLPPIHPSTSSTAAAHQTSLCLPDVPETPEYPGSSTGWTHDNTFNLSNPTSSGAPTASGTGTPSSTSPSHGRRTVMVSYHGATNGVLSTVDPVYASGQCLVILEEDVLAPPPASGASGAMNLNINFESAALLNSLRVALKGGKVTVQGAAAELVQYLQGSKHSNTNTNLNNNFVDTTRAGMFFPEQDATAFNNSNGGDNGVAVESLFAGMTLDSVGDSISNHTNSTSLPPPPPGFSFGSSHDFGLDLNI